MKLAIAQHVQSFEALDRQLAYATISDDPQNFQRCAARERTQELDACLASGVPCFLIVDKEESRGVRMAGYGYQNLFRRHELYDIERRPVESLEGYEVLLRAIGGYERSLLEFIESQGGKNIAPWPSQVLTLEWYKHLRPEYLKRKLAWFPIDSAYDQELSGFKDDQGRFFCKTNLKATGYAEVTDDLIGFFDYQLVQVSHIPARKSSAGAGDF